MTIEPTREVVRALRRSPLRNQLRKLSCYMDHGHPDDEYAPFLEVAAELADLGVAIELHAFELDELPARIARILPNATVRSIPVEPSPDDPRFESEALKRLADHLQQLATRSWRAHRDPT